jgi:hypothetical protein
MGDHDAPDDEEDDLPFGRHLHEDDFGKLADTVIAPRVANKPRFIRIAQ